MVMAHGASMGSQLVGFSTHRVSTVLLLIATLAGCARVLEAATPCRYSFQCPAGFCCSGNATVPGSCVSSVFSGGKQVCRDCGSFAGQKIACPKSASVCCPSGLCASSVAGCKCNYNFQCPRYSCCRGNGTVAGFCSASIFDKAGKQVCPDCLSLKGQEMACPKDASVCCPNGACQKSVTGCACNYNFQCPRYSCCRGNGTVANFCYPSIFDSTGKQVCKDCGTLQGQEMGCPKNASVCCPNGACHSSVTGCQCNYNFQCPRYSCCRGNGTVANFCYPSVFRKGKQVCLDCLSLKGQEMACPKDASLCCPNGSCQKSVSGCKCNYNFQCPRYACCQGNGTVANFCSPSIFNKAGKQVCPDCTTFNGQEIACPKPTSVCCPTGSCQTAATGCPCRYNFQCPRYSCCKGNGTVPGLCATSIFSKGKQVCPDCNSFPGQELACPASASKCCSKGQCKSSC